MDPENPRLVPMDEGTGLLARALEAESRVKVLEDLFRSALHVPKVFNLLTV
jgi:hypothetical protein